MVTSKNLISGSIDFSTCSYISEEDHHAISKRSKVDDGDILYAMIGTIGNPVIVEKTHEFSIKNVALFKFEKSEVFNRYIYHFLNSPLATRQFENKSRGGTQKFVSLGNIRDLEIPLPPLPEQKRIAAILDKADAIRRKRQQAIQLADEFLRAVFLDMFGDPVTNPKGWDVRSIDELCTEIVDCVNRTAPTVDYPTPYKMIRTTNVRNYSLETNNVRYVSQDTYLKWIRRLEPKIGDLIFTREAPAGEAAVVSTDEKIFLGQRTMHFRPDRKQISSEYLMFELMGSGVKRQIEKMHAGSTVTHLSVPECKKFKIRVPPLGLQNKFDAIRMVVLQSENVRAVAAEIPLFESISQKAFAGGF
nr:restriction endonuclease subunit S [Ketobacter sp. MCCC 1A13808]